MSKRGESGGGKRKKLHFNKLLSFARNKKSQLNVKHVSHEGFSRVIYCNNPNHHESPKLHNYISTTKYTILTFIPKSLFEQFRRVANFFFLLVGCLSFTKLAPYTAISAIIPLIIVVGASMIKEGIEDVRRKRQDMELNNRKVKVHNGDGRFFHTQWRHLRVGDIVKIEKDNFFPADLLLLSSSYEDSICYVETLNLDGETNLKLKQAMDVASSLSVDSNFKDFSALVRCEDPNANLYTFVGTLTFDEQLYSLSPQQLLLRDSKLRNTDYIYGVVIFTGHETKVMQNATSPPSKRSKVEKRMDKIIYLLFAIIFVIASFGSIAFGVETKRDLENDKMRRWYLRPDDSTIYFDPKRSATAAIYHFLTFLMLCYYLIPISLYVSIEIVKLLQSNFINKDLELYYEEADKPANARTSNLNEELGQVHTILSDKTGTLTCNSMEFLKCTIAGSNYGNIMSGDSENSTSMKPEIKGFNFKDERIMNGNWVNEPRADVIQKFFQLLAICHTAIPEVDKETGSISFEAESPDEASFVIAAKELGFEFYERTQTNIVLHELNPVTGIKVNRSYNLLNILEFNSSRKRMSVIVKNEDGKLLLLVKGADSVMFERLSESGREFEARTRSHINEYAEAGLRTLILAYRELEEEEYNDFSEEFVEAKNLVSADRDAVISAAMEKIEKDLILLGATAVEDKLQNGVPQCIEKLAQAGIKLWVLTGDKMETAINIGYSCRLLRHGMTHIIINLDMPEMIALEKTEDKNSITKASKESVINQIIEGNVQLTSSREKNFSLIIDGKSLAYALDDDVKNMFLELAVSCASVICCRTSPKQKALVTRLVKTGTGKTTLAIGDGANDVGMLQEADIGIGISGAEGMQAIMASDVAIAQFRYLERLLLVHGHWCYRRISSMICYFMYKNVAFGFTLFILEAHSSFSGLAGYNDWYMSFFNVLFAGYPATMLGIFEQDVSARSCREFPLIYREGINNALFSWTRILRWILSGICSAFIIFYFCALSYGEQAFRKGGQTSSLDILGATMYTCVVWVVNIQMALHINYFTIIQHIVIWGSVSLWYLFMLVYGAMPSDKSTTAYKIFVETLMPTPSYWIVVLLTVICSLIPYFLYKAIRSQSFPKYHEMINALLH